MEPNGHMFKIPIRCARAQYTTRQHRRGQPIRVYQPQLSHCGSVWPSDHKFGDHRAGPSSFVVRERSRPDLT